MLRFGLASATLCLICSAALAYHKSVASGRHQRGFEIADAVSSEVKPPAPSCIAERVASNSREVIWLPELDGESPFRFIPTEWTVRPQLLPRTWDATITFASDGR